VQLPFQAAAAAALSNSPTGNQMGITKFNCLDGQTSEVIMIGLGRENESRMLAGQRVAGRVAASNKQVDTWHSWQPKMGAARLGALETGEWKTMNLVAWSARAANCCVHCVP